MMTKEEYIKSVNFGDGFILVMKKHMIFEESFFFMGEGF